MRNRLYEDVKLWQAKKPEDELWTGSKLEQILELKKDENFNQVLGGFNTEANQFIDASVEVRDRQFKRKLRAISITSVVLAVFTIFAGFQWQNAKKAEQQSNDLLNKVGQVSWDVDEVQPNYEKALQYIYSEIIEDSNAKKELLAIAYKNRGTTHNQLEDYQAAIDDYNEAIGINPDFAETYNNRGLSHYNLENYQAAIDDYTEAIGINPNHALAYNNRGLSHRNLEDYQAAIDDYTQAIGIDPDDAEAYYNRGISHRNLEDYQAAIDDFTQAIGIDPNYANAYYNRGLSHYNLENYQAAIDDFTKAANLYRQQGRTDDYQDAINQIKELQQRSGVTPSKVDLPRRSLVRQMT